MIFKNIQQLKKEIEEGGEGIGGAQIQLQTLQEVCKEIKKFIGKLEFEKEGLHEEIGYCTTCLYEKDFKELLKKFQGEER